MKCEVYFCFLMLVVILLQLISQTLPDGEIWSYLLNQYELQLLEYQLIIGCMVSGTWQNIKPTAFILSLFGNQQKSNKYDFQEHFRFKIERCL